MKKSLRNSFIGLMSASLMLAVLSCSNLVDSNTEEPVNSKNLSMDSSKSSKIGEEDSIKITNDDSYVYISINDSEEFQNYNFFINTDGDSTTGYQAPQYWTKSGADFLISAGILYKSTGSGWDWLNANGDCSSTKTAQGIEFKIALSSLDITADDLEKLSLGYISYAEGWSDETTIIPNKNTDMVTPLQKKEIDVEDKKDTNNTEKCPIGRGLIIPAYIRLDETAMWAALAEGAKSLSKNTSENAPKDFFVTVNSGNNGPFEEAADWEAAATVWNPIRENGGRIFGYVHTCQDPNLPYFRPLDDVKGDIEKWVTGYPELDGIWLDEFYPRYEIAGIYDTVPTYPNGKELAPDDKSKFDDNGAFIYDDVDPTGGYYHKLCSWIRKAYPKLRIIGNHGGALWSNQKDYGKLVDILVAFEQNWEYARNNGDWKEIRRTDNGNADNKLALGHGVSETNMLEFMEESFTHGFTHVYITDRGYGESGELNVWGGLASYLSAEIEALKNF